MPRTWGRWEHIGDQPEEGGQAHVFKVKDTKGQLQGDYALKRLKNDKRIDRFESEVLITSSIDSPYVAKVYDYDLSGDKPYYVMDYFENGSLEKYREKRPGAWSFADKIAICVEIASAIAVLQDSQPPIIHRDLKPDNIYLTNDGKSVVIGDFGLSYDEDGARHTLSWEAVGSRFYMHPDFENGGQIEVHSFHDFYSFGKIIYWIFSEGKIFNREAHRTPNFNLIELKSLKDREENLGLFAMINNLLDRLITLNTETRIHHIDIIRSELVKIQRVHMHDFHPLLDEHGAHTCDFCGLGKYHDVGSAANIFNPGGPTMSVNPDFRKIMICENCGHMQMFVFGLGNQKKNWFRRN